MKNKVLQDKITHKEKQATYTKGMIVGSVVVINDILKRANAEDKTADEKIEEIIKYCTENQSRLTGKKEDKDGV